MTTVRGCVKMNRSLLSPPRRSLLLPCLLVATSAVVVLFTFHGYTLSLPPLPVQRRVTHTTRRTSDAETRGDQHRETWPRILCLIVTSPQYHEERAVHVAATWATHCTRAVFLTTANHTLLPDTLITPGVPAYHQLWEKVTQGFLWAYKQQREFDWVVKTDDDTFLLVENLRGALSSLDPHRSLATGALLRAADTNMTFLSGGAGYVLSRGAVVRLVEEGLKDQQCRKALKLDSREDVNMGLCLSYIGVKLLDSRDASGRQRFYLYPPRMMVDPRQTVKNPWLQENSVFPHKFGFAELSDEVISFHYVDAHTIYLLYYLIYFVNPTVSASISTFRLVSEVQLHPQSLPPPTITVTGTSTLNRTQDPQPPP